jgi:hypothetical protein
MLGLLMNSLFGCSHQRTTFPLTPGRHGNLANGTAETRGRMYVACLDCGKELDYDWKSMRIGQPLQVPMATNRPYSLQG